MISKNHKFGDKARNKPAGEGTFQNVCLLYSVPPYLSYFFIIIIIHVISYLLSALFLQ